jgi:hypothetical protein
MNPTLKWCLEQAGATKCGVELMENGVCIAHDQWQHVAVATPYEHA